MNITQRKFTLARIHNIYKDKLSALSDKSYQAFTDSTNALEITNRDIILGIKTGEVSVNFGAHEGLDEKLDPAIAFNLTKLMERKKAAVALAYPLIKKTSVCIQDPINKTTYARHYTVYTQEHLDLAEELIQEFKNDCDLIMLGDSKLCMNIISKAEALVV